MLAGTEILDIVKSECPEPWFLVSEVTRDRSRPDVGVIFIDLLGIEPGPGEPFISSSITWNLSNPYDRKGFRREARKAVEDIFRLDDDLEGKRLFRLNYNIYKARCKAKLADPGLIFSPEIF